ncbi:MAG: hypothetical protein KIT80_04865 [Chitinophagaceae bacterium]|nr:hypothetical protein [Chitinophagaceae bacterium]MCW5926224.1 hypothetical protein [Chitinophagaceae bacterium]
MRSLFISVLLLASFSLKAQWKNYIISIKGDTLNRVDANDKKQGPWVVKVEELRGEPGYEEEGFYEDSRKDGIWRVYSLSGDLIAIENYKWGEKDGKQQYYTKMGDLLREESWRATNPENPYDTLEVPDPEVPDKWETKIIKLEVATVAHGTWKYYEPGTGFIIRQENYFFGQLDKKNLITAKAGSEEKKAVEKPREVEEWEKKNSGKKKVKVRDGRTGF